MPARRWHSVGQCGDAVAGETTTKHLAWIAFDRIVAEAAPEGVHDNPWRRTDTGSLRYQPDYATLCRLLAVPLALDAPSQSGVPALALDVWLSYELRRAGFDQDATWPRAAFPRVLPAPIANLLAGLPKQDREALSGRLTNKVIKGVTASSANILGKNYMKQVDVVMSDWATGPELLISTKRMDSSYGKNAANRVEESYGDAKNLRLRHPLAALGFVFGLRSDILIREPDTAVWLMDLLTKLGREDDAYHATCLIMIEYDDRLAVDIEESADPENPLVAAGLEDPDDESESAASAIVSGAEQHALDALSRAPVVALRQDVVPPELDPARFLAVMVQRIFDATPVNRHVEARQRRRAALD